MKDILQNCEEALRQLGMFMSWFKLDLPEFVSQTNYNYHLGYFGLYDFSPKSEPNQCDIRHIMHKNVDFLKYKITFFLVIF